MTSANADGIWTATASASAGQGALTGWATFTGPEGKTRRMGMCLVQRDRAHPDGVACATAMDCDSVPARLPAGGSRYCVSAYGAEAKYCHYRPGPQSAYCVGSPALAGAEIAPGAYRKDIAAQPGSQWLALACFEGCAETPPSISASVTVK